MTLLSDKIIRGVIVLGGHVQALGIVRIYGRMGIPVIVLESTSKCIARHSKYCQRFFKVNEDKIEDFLLSSDFAISFFNWVIFPTNDMHVKVLSINKVRLEQNYIVSTDKWESVREFHNKKRTYQLAEKIGVPIPATFYPESNKDLVWLDIKYPCIIKPAVMYDFYRRTRKKVLLCRNLEELKVNYAKALGVIPAEEILIQEVIPGGGRNQYSACFLYLEGKSFLHLTACRMRQHPINFGNATTYAEITFMPKLIEYGERLLKAANYNGVCEVEFKLDARDNLFRLLEVNPRTWKWHSIANKANTPFLPLYYNYLIGKIIEPVNSLEYASFCHYTTDLPVRFLLLLKGSNYWNRLVKPVEKAIWSKSDPWPCFYEKLYLVRYLMER